MQFAYVVAAVLSLGWAVVLWARLARLRRESYIRAVEFPRGLFDKLKARHPHLSTKDCQLVAHGLRQFFLAHLKSGRQFVSMPSQVVDDLWHEFILYTKNYQLFCRRGFGRFLHHSPAAILSGNRQRNIGLRRCWWYACREENINPRSPTRLPLLFALDTKLRIDGGFRYVPDCTGVRREGDQGGSSPYCGGDFSDNSYDGSTDGFGSGDGGDGGGDGGGCGGGGD